VDVAGWPVVSPAKCTRPRVSASFLPRPRLTRVLDRAAPGQVVVVCAPAGFGKTQLLADWLADRVGAWATLDADDDADDRFWAGLLAALDGVPGADRTLSALPRPATPSRDPAFVASVVDAVAAAGPITLVLDDVHTVSAPDPLHGLAALLRYRPTNLLLVLATRSDATLRLDRLRLGEEVVDQRAGDLAFTRDETSALLAASGSR
jgi:LuxR family transcriptional regulator, maltose regulon positive regulatory protein